MAAVACAYPARIRKPVDNSGVAEDAAPACESRHASRRYPTHRTPPRPSKQQDRRPLHRGLGPRRGLDREMDHCGEQRGERQNPATASVGTAVNCRDSTEQAAQTKAAMKPGICAALSCEPLLPANNKTVPANPAAQAAARENTTHDHRTIHRCRPPTRCPATATARTALQRHNTVALPTRAPTANVITAS